MFKKLLVLCLVWISFSLEAKSLSGFFDKFIDGFPVSEELRNSALENHYVLISGFLNERAPFYWDDAVEALLTMGVPQKHITLIHPSSANTIEMNSTLLKKEIESIATKRPLVILSHSKGAVETFNFAWKNPEFVKSRIKALFFIQGAFGGSPIADHLYSGHLKMDSRMPLAYRLGLNFQFYLERLLLQNYSESLNDLTTEVASSRQSKQLSSKGAAHEDISDRFFFITSSTKTGHLCFYLANAGMYLKTYHGANDGLLLIGDQSLPFIGKTIAHFQADHSDFVISYPISKQPQEFRFAFTNALLAWLSQPKPTRSL